MHTKLAYFRLKNGTYSLVGQSGVPGSYHNELLRYGSRRS